MYITQALHRISREAPGALCSIDGSRRRTWAELRQRVAHFAGMLQRLGLGPGDRVGMLARNGDHYLDFLFGTIWAGGALNPVNIRWTPAEMGFSLQDCETRILLVDDEFWPIVDELRAEAPCLRSVLRIGPESRFGIDGYDRALTAADAVEDTFRRDGDLAAILYTGGTTGRPKGVMLTHRSMLASAMSYAGARDCAPGASFLHSAPLFHVGAISGLLASILRKSCHIFLPAFAPRPLMEAIALHRVTDTFLIPTMLQIMLDHPQFNSYDLSSLERIIYGASPMPSALIDRAVSALPGVGFVQAYGMTELSPIATLLGPEDHGSAGRRHSAGRATMASEIRIVDPHGCEVATGESGEIVVRGAIVMAGYWNHPEQTAAVLRHGWMHSGDVGRMDQDGYLYVVDRMKDMIISGGENIYSLEVENALALHPGIAQCAVVGVPDPRWGEVVHAFVVAVEGRRPTEAQLLKHCRGILAGYKCPRVFRFTDALPVSAMGKVLKKELRQHAQQTLPGGPEA